MQVDLTACLEDSPSRAVHVSLRPAEHHEAGTAVYRVEVAVLDDAERVQIGKRRHRLGSFVQRDRDRHLLVFQANGNPTDVAWARITCQVPVEEAWRAAVR